MTSTTEKLRLVDVGVNLTNRAFRRNWRSIVRNSSDAGVDRLVLTGTDLESSQQSLTMAETWMREIGVKSLTATVGVHPHHANQFNKETLAEMKRLLQHPLAVAVGECGLDYNRNYSTPDEQQHAFREQVILACQLQKPLFLHEREAHEDLIRILDGIAQDDNVPPLPPVLVHCFTGTREEAQVYLERGFFLSFAGTICKFERGAPLREILPMIPLDRIMVETDAPFMGFVKGRRGSVPADTRGVASKVAETFGISLEEVAKVTTGTAVKFFGLEQDAESVEKE